MKLADEIIQVEIWEGDERVITVGGKPVGGTISKRDSQVIRNWLLTAAWELRFELDKIENNRIKETA